MNRRPTGSLSLAKAISGFLQYKAAEGLSPNTLQSYQRDLKLWLEYAGDIPLHQITTPLLQEYFVWLRTDYQPRRITGNRQSLASKTIHNFYISLWAFFTWAKREFDLPNPNEAIPAPKFEQAPSEPFTKEEVEAWLKACELCCEAQTTERRKYTMRRATGRRDQAIIMTLLDAGLRASELSALKVGDVDLKSGKVLVKHGRLGGAKGGKGRTVYLGKAARRAVWRYRAEREDGEEPEAPLFLVSVYSRMITGK